MADTMRLEIVTPDGTAYSQDVEMVTMDAVEGQIGILPYHTRLMTQLVPGENDCSQRRHEELLAVGEGLVVVTGTHVSVLTDMAIAAEKIDEAKVEEARQRAAAACLTKFPTKKSPRSMPLWFARWCNCV